MDEQSWTLLRGGPIGWQRAAPGVQYQVGPVDHVLPPIDFGEPAPCLLRPFVLTAMRAVLAYTHQILTDAEIPHWLTIGTLLGAYRHSGFIPWDDDIDLQVPLDHRARLESLSPRIAADGFMLMRAAGGYKLATGNVWRYPYVDLIMVAPREDRLALAFPLDRSGLPTFGKARQWPRENYRAADIWPLATVAFEDLSLPVPRAGLMLVEQLYGADALARVRHRRWARWHNHLFMMTCFRLGLSGG